MNQMVEWRFVCPRCKSVVTSQMEMDLIEELSDATAHDNHQAHMKAHDQQRIALENKKAPTPESVEAHLDTDGQIMLMLANRMPLNRLVELRDYLNGVFQVRS